MPTTVGQSSEEESQRKLLKTVEEVIAKDLLSAAVDKAHCTETCERLKEDVHRKIDALINILRERELDLCIGIEKECSAQMKKIDHDVTANCVDKIMKRYDENKRAACKNRLVFNSDFHVLRRILQNFGEFRYEDTLESAKKMHQEFLESRKKRRDPISAWAEVAPSALSAGSPFVVDSKTASKAEDTAPVSFASPFEMGVKGPLLSLARPFEMLARAPPLSSFAHPFEMGAGAPPLSSFARLFKMGAKIPPLSSSRPHPTANPFLADFFAESRIDDEVNLKEMTDEQLERQNHMILRKGRELHEQSHMLIRKRRALDVQSHMLIRKRHELEEQKCRLKEISLAREEDLEIKFKDKLFKDLRSLSMPQLSVSDCPVTPSPGQKSSPGTVSVAPSVGADPEKRKLIQQQLLLHADKCQGHENQSNGEVRQCSLPNCRIMKHVLSHMKTCQAGMFCDVPLCSSSRQIMSHWENCTHSEYPVCGPLKQASDHGQQQAAAVQTNQGPAPADIQRASAALGLPFKAGNGCENINPVIQQSQTVSVPHVNEQTQCSPQSLNLIQTLQSAQPNQQSRVQFPLLQDRNTKAIANATAQSFKIGDNLQSKVLLNSTPNQVAPIVPGVIPDNPTTSKDWHQSATQDLRHQLVQKIVQTIFPTADISELQDKRMINLVAVDRKIEGDMYEAANSMDEYYQSLSEKIYNVLTEMEEKRPERKEMEMQQQVGPGLGPILSNNSSAATPKPPPPPVVQMQNHSQVQSSRHTVLNVEDSNGDYKSVSEEGVSSVSQIDTQQNTSVSSTSDETGGKVLSFASEKSTGENSKSEKMEIEGDRNSVGKQEPIVNVKPSGKPVSQDANMDVKGATEEGFSAISLLKEEQTVEKEEIASPAPVPSVGENGGDTKPDSSSESTQPSKHKPNKKIFKPDELHQAWMPTLEKLNKQDPESLPFHHSVCSLLLPFELLEEDSSESPYSVFSEEDEEDYSWDIVGYNSC